MAIKNFQFPGVELTQYFVDSTVPTESTLGAAVIGRHYKLHRAGVEGEEALMDVAYDPNTTNVKALPDHDPNLTVDTSETPVAGVSGTSFQKLLVYDGIWNYYTSDGSQGSSSIWTEYQQNPSKKWTDIPAGQSPVWSATDNDLTVTVLKDEVTSIVRLRFTDSTTEHNPVPVAHSDKLITVAKFGTRGVHVGDPIILDNGSTRINTIVTGLECSTNTSGYDTIVLPALESVDTTATYVIRFCIAKSDVYLQGYASVTGADLDQVSINAGIETEVDLGSATPAAALIELPNDGTYTMAFQYREIQTKFSKEKGVTTLADIKDILGAPCLANPLALGVLFAAAAAPGVEVSFMSVEDDTAASFTNAIDIMSKYSDLYSFVPLTSNEINIQACLNMLVEQSEDAESKVRRTLWYGIDPSYGSLTPAELVERVIEKRVTNSYRAQAVFADHVMFNEEEIPNYIVAAAPAGMRSYEPAHRPLSNLTYDFFTVTEASGFTQSQLRRIGSNGIWIIANNADEIPINKKQVTTAVANNLLLDEESIVANADEIALSLCHIGEDLVGCSNISDALIMGLSDSIATTMNKKLINETGSAYIGPQLLNWTLDSIYQDPVQRDHIYAVITCEPPRPFNRFVMTLRIV